MFGCSTRKARALTAVLLLLCVFCASIATVGNTCHAAPGDMIDVYTLQQMTITSNVAGYGAGFVEMGYYSNGYIDICISNISMHTMRFTTGFGYTGYTFGTVTLSVRKNGINGPVLYEATYTNPWISIGNLYIGIGDAISYASLYPGESVRVYVANNLEGYGGRANIRAYDSSSYEWAMNFLATDMAVQKSIDNAAVASYYAQQAKSSADTAAANAQNAYNAANAAKSSADTAAAYAQQAANNTTYNSQSAAYWAYLAATNTSPRIEKVQGLNGATCTTGTSFTVVISATGATQYRVTCGSFDSGWTANNQITINSGMSSGANTATVQVKNAAGNTAQTSFTFFKL